MNVCVCWLQARPLNTDGSLNLLGWETVRLVYFRNKTAGKSVTLQSVVNKISLA